MEADLLIQKYGLKNQNCIILDIFDKTSEMKKAAFIFFIAFLIFYTGNAQEIPVVEEASSDFIIKRTKIAPSLSILSPEIPNTGNFRIRSVNFDTANQPREVNISEYLEEEKRRKSRIVELDPPVVLPKQDNGTFSVTKNTDFGVRPTTYFNQSFSPNLPSNGTYNSVYRDASISTGAYYLNRYTPYNPFRRGYYHY